MINSGIQLRRLLSISSAAACLALIAVGCARSGASSDSPAPGSAAANMASPAAAMGATNATYEHDIQPLLQKYCYACHGNGQARGRVTLDNYKTEADVKADPNRWTAVRQEIDTKDMPPRQQQAQPTDAERKLITDWIKKAVPAS